MPPMMPGSCIDIEQFNYPDGTVALADIRLEVQQGEFCGLLGANGSGKTTLLKVMDGLIRDYGGRCCSTAEYPQTPPPGYLP